MQNHRGVLIKKAPVFHLWQSFLCRRSNWLSSCLQASLCRWGCPDCTELVRLDRHFLINSLTYLHLGNQANEIRLVGKWALGYPCIDWYRM